MWQLQEAKNKFSQVVDEACEKGPQVITRRGEEVAVVISYPDYIKMRRSKESLSKFFKSSPLTGSGIKLERDKSPVRRLNDFSA